MWTGRLGLFLLVLPAAVFVVWVLIDPFLDEGAAVTPHQDPSGLAAAVGTLVGAGLALLVAFGVPLTDTQQTAILSFWAAVAPLLTALWVRRHAWAPHSVEQRLAEQAEAFAGEQQPWD